MNLFYLTVIFISQYASTPNLHQLKKSGITFWAPNRWTQNVMLRFVIFDCIFGNKWTTPFLCFLPFVVTSIFCSSVKIKIKICSFVQSMKLQKKQVINPLVYNWICLNVRFIAQMCVQMCVQMLNAQNVRFIASCLRCRLKILPRIK